MKQFLFFLVFTIGVDQLSKYVGSNIQLNTGISFGLFSGMLLTAVLVGVLILIAIQFAKTFFSLSPAASGIFFGGAISNILDRIFYGGVRDFLPVPILSVRNNLADWAIVLSLVWFLLASRYNTSHEPRRA